MAADPALLRSLEEVVGPSHVITDPDVMAGFLVDWTGRFRGEADAVVRPVCTSEVAGVLEACRAAGVPLVAQGGNSSLVGGATPVRRGELPTDG
jgi:FAD/FMN-containing dehydrogenase